MKKVKKHRENESFGYTLDVYMNEQKTDIPELSLLTGISTSSLSYYRSEKRKISIDHLAAICIALKLHPLKSLYLFKLARYQMNFQAMRDRIVLDYILGCFFNPDYNLKNCNDELKRNEFRQLTTLKEKGEISDESKN